MRITTRYDEADFAQALMGVMHETGHALYERGLPAAWARQPVGEAGRHGGAREPEPDRRNAGLPVGRLPGLARARVARRCSAATRRPMAGDNLARLWRRVARGLIRVDADEMTYPAHVILRFRLERAMVAGDLGVADLPGAWNDGHGDAARHRAARTTRAGCLQDIHWYDGGARLFPELHDGRDGGGAVDGGGAAGGAGPRCGARARRAWARSLVGCGRMCMAWAACSASTTCCVHATGKPLDPLDFEAHLTARYLT